MNDDDGNVPIPGETPQSVPPSSPGRTPGTTPLPGEGLQTTPRERIPGETMRVVRGNDLRSRGEELRTLRENDTIDPPSLDGE
jgi:hypothetical protein